MRRKISLFIADQIVDLDDQAVILYNYAMEDLNNPTIVKNSYSQQITLKGTPANNRIFGASFRVDRQVGNQAFNASRKTPFTIYNERNEILETGYVKLDSVTRKGADVQYKVTLYGGLGSFFYALSYDDDGNKRTLASLDYLLTGNPDAELDFAITKESVQAAWNRLDESPDDVSTLWDVINFAPAYNGIPEGNFAPDKALVVPSSVGLQDTIINEGVRYGLKSGYALVNLSQAQDEWSVKDLRSYLQRPVFSMRAFWNAICNPDNNGGYEVDASVLQDFARFQYGDLWMTLPLISSIGSIKQETGELSLNLTSTPTSGNAVGRYDIVGIVPSGTKTITNLSCKLRFNMESGADAHEYLDLSTRQQAQGRVDGKTTAMFIQAVAYGSDDTIVGGSKVRYLGVTGQSVKDVVKQCGYVPAWNTDVEYVQTKESSLPFHRVGQNLFELIPEFGFTIESTDAAYYKILVSVYPGTFYNSVRGSGSYYSGDGQTSTPTMYFSYNIGYRALSAFAVQGETGNTISYTTTDSLRSGARITKSMLLSSSATPAEYMLSFCKMFGLSFVYDPATRKVTILRRNDLYQDDTIDLTDRVDLSQGITILPIFLSAKWYDFLLESDGGAFYNEYMNVEGVQYGIQRVNTGYDFNADSINLMDSVVFKNAVTILDRSQYYNIIHSGGVFLPSPFVDKGNTYTLWSATGETLETDISCPPADASIEYYNEVEEFKGYDINFARKLELRTADKKPIDGSNVLVFLEGWNEYDMFKLTDDVPAMDFVNEGVPCWLLGAGDGQRIPIFSRYTFGNGYGVRQSLDFGVPRQLDIPGVTYDETCTIYQRFWRKYLADRFDNNTKVMTCKVDFSGIQVNQGILRKFYWYNNTLWVLNKIRNYSLTTFDPVECEFVQVQDKDNYLNGQN